MTDQKLAGAIGEGQQPAGQKNYFEVGEILRRRRLERSLKQSDVARSLRLPGMIINDLETGRVDHLSSLYLRGYIRNYARLLELDADELLGQVESGELPELGRILPVTRRRLSFERYLKMATYLIVTIAIVPPLVYFFVAGGARMLDRSSGQQIETARLADAPGGQPAGSASAPALKLPEKPVSTHISASSLPLSDRLLKDIRGSAIEEAPEADDEAEGGADSTTSRLVLTLDEDSWIEIRDAQGNRLEYDLLRSGAERVYEGEPPFSLLLGRASSASLKIDGNAVSWPEGGRGDVAEIVVSADGQVL
ncbi:MAG TPA: RodZ domain-containing protein [Wenzhouxiangella sp.]|nr:RodZ domain-containing protein [Wenzhouxiangella sp.]